MSKHVLPKKVILEYLQIVIAQKNITLKYIEVNHYIFKLNYDQNQYLLDSILLISTNVDHLILEYNIYEYFPNFELSIMVCPSLQQYGQNSLLFIIHKKIKLIRFTNFHLVHNNEFFFLNMLLRRIPFMIKKNTFRKYHISILCT